MKTNTKAFTLVELIVVISILIILGTIAFISMQNYTKTSRDSVRLSDMSRIKTSLELFQIEAAKYPDPDGSITISYSGSTAWTQWEFWQIGFQSVDKLDILPVDPLTEKQYDYSVTNTKKEYQLAWVMETDEYSLNMNTANAWTEIGTLNVTWNYNGEIIKVQSGTTTYVLAVPSIITSSWTDLTDIIANDKLAYDGYSNLPASYSTDGTFKQIWETTPLNLVQSSNMVIYSWDLSDLATDTTKQQTMLSNLKSAYSWTDIAWEANISRLTNITPTDPVQQETITRAVVYGTKKSLTSDSISIATTAVTYSSCTASTIDWYSIPSLNHLETSTQTKTTTTIISDWDEIQTDTYRCNNWTVENISSSTSIVCDTWFQESGWSCVAIVNWCTFWSSTFGGCTFQ